MQTARTPDDDTVRDGPGSTAPRLQRSTRAIAALQVQYDEKITYSNGHLAAEQSIRWEERTATVLEETVGTKAAENFRSRGQPLRTASIASIRDRQEAKRMYLIGLMHELHTHPDAVFEREARSERAAPAASSSISVDELQERLVTVLGQLKENLSGEARRYGRFISRVIGIGFVLLVLSIALPLLKLVIAYWDTIEPIGAWVWVVWMVVNVVISIATGWRLPIPKISSIVEKWATKRRFNRISRLIDFDAAAATIRRSGSQR